MEETPPTPPSSGTPQPGNPPGEAPKPPDSHAPVSHPAGARRVKWRMMLLVIFLYLGSIGAASVLILRGSPDRDGGTDGESFGSLLSGAPKESVGWVRISGPIYESRGDSIFDKGSRQWARRIKILSETDGVKAIVLDINSPGGSVGAVQEIYSQILRIKKEKGIPFVALFGDVAASGGYYLAAACDKIVAHPGTLTGSIGVIFSVSNMEGLFKKIGYKTDPIKSGIHKDIGSPARPMTKIEREILQALIDDAYGQFVSAVSLGRNMSIEDVKKIADGRIYSGNQALALGMVDVLGDSIDALELAGKLGGIEGRPKIRRETDSLRGIIRLLETRYLGSPVNALLERLPAMPHSGLEYRWAGL